MKPKKVQLASKKSFLGFRGFRTVFLLLATYVMFEIKKNLKFLLYSKIKPKKLQLAGKKVS